MNNKAHLGTTHVSSTIFLFNFLFFFLVCGSSINIKTEY